MNRADSNVPAAFVNVISENPGFSARFSDPQIKPAAVRNPAESACSLNLDSAKLMDIVHAATFGTTFERSFSVTDCHVKSGKSTENPNDSAVNCLFKSLTVILSHAYYGTGEKIGTLFLTLCFNVKFGTYKLRAATFRTTLSGFAMQLQPIPTIRPATDEEIWSRKVKTLYVMQRGDQIKIGVSASMKRRLKDVSGARLIYSFIVSGVPVLQFERRLIEKLAGKLCCWTVNEPSAALDAIEGVIIDYRTEREGQIARAQADYDALLAKGTIDGPIDLWRYNKAKSILNQPQGCKP